MVISAHRTLVIVFCVGLLALHPNDVSCVSSMELALRWSREGRSLLQKNQRILKAVVMKEPSTEMRAAPVNKETDPFQSSKRKVGKGSDPIHNRC